MTTTTPTATDRDEVRLVRASDLHVADWNPRSISADDFEAVRTSLDDDPDFLWARPVCAMADGTVYAGAQRLEAARTLGPAWSARAFGTPDGELWLPAVVGDVNPTKARERAIRDNHHGGEDDRDKIRAVMAQIRADGGNPEATGISADRVARLLAYMPKHPPRRQDEDELDAAEQCQEAWGTEPGQTWVVPSRSMPGALHRLRCGDATAPEDVAALMDGAASSLLWTDPPYGVNYQGGTEDELTLAGDTAEGLGALLRGAFAAVDLALVPSAPFYICHPSGPLALTFGQAIVAAGWRIHETLVWVKDAFVIGHGDYHYGHETLFYGQTAKRRRGAAQAYAAGHQPIYYGWTAGPTSSARGQPTSRWYGGDAASTVFRVEKPMRSTLHPTMKPLELIAQHIGNSSRPGEIVLDPFAGSGSTLLAAEASARLGYGLELDPKYLAVALERLSRAGLSPRRED